ncbi:hypothetical protein TYRP_015257 [Tyrophagus putrescentiae]|nr:hypothetical protein TYRP_015257 [Tyrophagus putrescentiae]
MILKKSFLQTSLYYQLYHYQDLVERLGVNFFHRRRLQQQISTGNIAAVLTSISHPPSITFLRLFYLVFLVRCAAILFLPVATSSQLKRILLLVEHWRQNAVNCEGTFCPSNLLHFKWLALFRMTDRPSDGHRYLHPGEAGLSPVDFWKFKRFRRALKLYYHSIFASVVPMFSLAMIVLVAKVGLFRSWPRWAYLYSVFYSVSVYICCSSLYSLFLSFNLTARYIQIKQRSLAEGCARSLAHLVAHALLEEVAVGGAQNVENDANSKASRQVPLLYHLAAFQRRHAHYVTLFAELADYNRFWAGYLSTVFLVYSTIVAFALYIILYAEIIWYLNVAYGFVLLNHALNMTAIIAISGQVALQQQQWAYRCASLTGRLTKTKVGVLSTAQVIRLQVINEAVGSLNSAGFVLTNGMQISHQTFQALIANIGFYFFLTLQNILYGSNNRFSELNNKVSNNKKFN